MFKVLERRASLALLPDYWASASTHVVWFVDGALLVFLVPWVGTQLLDIDRSLYDVCWFVTSLGFLALYARLTGFRARRELLAKASLSIGIGTVAGVLLVAFVHRVDAAGRPGGFDLVDRIVWRGFGYGVVNGMVLAAFPGVVAREVVRHISRRRVRWPVSVGLSLTLVWVLSAVHHLGYDEIRDQDVVVAEAASTLAAMPTIVTGNPLGSIVAMSAFHIAAALRIDEADSFIPPFFGGTPEYQPPGVFRGGPH